MQELNRGFLSAAAGGDEIIQRVRVDGEDSLHIDTETWDTYWAGSSGTAAGPWRRALADLRRARETYFASGFQLADASRYCCLYFTLLRDLLAHGRDDPEILARLLQLEVFRVEADKATGAGAAGVLASRHPVYLLAKLCQPRTYDDPKFLPLMSAPANAGRADVLLLCRVLNNMSRFSIESSADPADHGKLAGRNRNMYALSQVHPARCLAGPNPNPSALIATNGRARLRGGRSFRQVSLSDDYRALAMLDQPTSDSSDDRNRLYFPLRRFDPACLLADPHNSLIEHCCRRADLVAIEDVDLSAEHLHDHLTAHRLNHLAASDATDRVRMQSASLLCITRREFAAALPGRRIW